MSIPGGNTGPDNYGFSGDGRSINPGNQGGGEGQQWLGDQIYNYNGRNGGDQGAWRNMGPMQFSSPDGREVFNIQNAYFNFGRAFGDQGDRQQAWGGYDQFANPQYDGQMMNPNVRALAARELQNYFLQQQEASMMNNPQNYERYAQNFPPQPYYSGGYRQWGAPEYFHHRHHGPEFRVASNPFYSGYYPGVQQPGISIGVGGHGGGFRFMIG